MFGTLAVVYLFLGGAGAGAIVLCSLIDLVWMKQPFGTAAYVPGPSVASRERIVDFGFLVGFLALAVGIVSLLLDLGRIDRALDLFLSPSPTLLTLGSYALAALVFIGACLALVRFIYLPDVPRSAVVALEVAALVVGAAVMLYTGLLLQTIGGVAFWASPLVPALFVLSSLSSGTALLFAMSCFAERDSASVRMVRGLARADAVLVVLEAVCAAAFVALAGASDHPGVRESFVALAEGNVALVWWFGFVACGLAAPLVLEAVHLCGQGTRVLLGIVAILVLVGAFCLRFSIVEAGVHRDLELEPAVEETYAIPDEIDKTFGT